MKIGERNRFANQDIFFPIRRWKGDFNALIDIGTGDNFYKQGQLLPENFEKAVREGGVEGVKVRYQEVRDIAFFLLVLLVSIS